MRNVNRIPVFCAAMEQVWKKYFPDFRFWQFVSVVAEHMESKYFRRDPFYAEEKDWLKALENLQKELDKSTEI